MKKNEIIKDRLEEWVESKGFLHHRIMQNYRNKPDLSFELY